VDLVDTRLLTETFLAQDNGRKDTAGREVVDVFGGIKFGWQVTELQPMSPPWAVSPALGYDCVAVAAGGSVAVMDADVSGIGVLLVESPERVQDRKHLVGEYRRVLGGALIELDRRVAARPDSFAGLVAHELAHARLIGEGRVAGLRISHGEEERLTDLVTVHLGMGVLSANAADDYVKVAGYSVMPVGELTDRMLTGRRDEPLYADLAFLAQTRGGSPREVLVLRGGPQGLTTSVAQLVPGQGVTATAMLDTDGDGRADLATFAPAVQPPQVTVLRGSATGLDLRHPVTITADDLGTAVPRDDAGFGSAFGP
jgi:hypothetical protein